MQSLHIVSVGKVKKDWIAEGCDLYRKRLSPVVQLSEHVIADADKETESEKILQHCAKRDGCVIALDETGKEYSSEKFAELIDQKRDQGIGITFIIGGAYGLTEEVRNHADIVLSFSKMTFPHEIAQLLLFEQLFRASAILRGSGYHH